MTELKKCPFCGGNPITRIRPTMIDSERDRLLFTIKCDTCGVEKHATATNSHFTFNDIEAWIKYICDEWNRRPE